MARATQTCIFTVITLLFTYCDKLQKLESLYSLLKGSVTKLCIVDLIQSKTELKLTYGHLALQKSSGVIPRTPLKGEWRAPILYLAQGPQQLKTALRPKPKSIHAQSLFSIKNNVSSIILSDEHAALLLIKSSIFCFPAKQSNLA